VEDKVLATVRDHFKPEFLNRVDDIIVFHRLSPDHLAHIVDLQLAAVSRRLAERDILLEVSDAARDYVARKGYEPAYGARPIKRLIQREILDPLALKLLDGTFVDGDAIRVESLGDSLELVGASPSTTS
jgi:ATP-dependent Clp protease ATP-binding subunit ClpB